ncbi:unnamed protein product [Amoebophrya sp. A120]|nr:unnamed protein product [Amoebophrya sp. A120]|eukprot:GSA120T00019728001.1
MPLYEVVLSYLVCCTDNNFICNCVSDDISKLLRCYPALEK